MGSKSTNSLRSDLEVELAIGLGSRLAGFEKVFRRCRQGAHTAQGGRGKKD